MDQIVRNDRYGRCLSINAGEAQQYDLKHTFMTSGYRLPTTLKRDFNTNKLIYYYRIRISEFKKTNFGQIIIPCEPLLSHMKTKSYYLPIP